MSCVSQERFCSCVHALFFLLFANQLMHESEINQKENRETFLDERHHLRGNCLPLARTQVSGCDDWDRCVAGGGVPDRLNGCDDSTTSS